MKMTREEAIKTLMLPAFAAAFGATTAVADAKSSKAALKYQDHPKGSQKCEGCKFYVPGKSTLARGSCKIVSGSISPNGWCVAYSKK